MTVRRAADSILAVPRCFEQPRAVQRKNFRHKLPRSISFSPVLSVSAERSKAGISMSRKKLIRFFCDKSGRTGMVADSVTFFRNNGDLISESVRE